MRISAFLCCSLLTFIIQFELWPSLSLAQSMPTYTAGVMTKSYDERRAKALEKFEEIIGKYLEERAGLKIQLKAFTYPDLMKVLEKEFGKNPSGIWTAERVWEPALAKSSSSRSGSYTIR